MKLVTYKLTITVNGVIKTQQITAYTVWGLIKHQLVRKLIEDNKMKELITLVKDSRGLAVARIAEASAQWSALSKLKWNIEPWALSWSPTQMPLYHSVSDKLSIKEYLAVKRLVQNPPRVRMIAKLPRIETIDYNQGLRDAVDTTSTTNPHQIRLIRLMGPIEVTLVLLTSKYDKTTVPECIELTPALAGKPYYQAFKEILENGLPEGEFEWPSTLGGRKFHQILVKVQRVEDNSNNDELKKSLKSLDNDSDWTSAIQKLNQHKFTDENKKLFDSQQQANTNQGGAWRW